MPDTPYRIGVVVGSLRNGSLNRKTALAMQKLAPPALQFDFIEIGDLPHYNEDLEADAPAPWTRFRDAVRSVEGVLFFTPEYNRSMPGVLKNAIDVGSRPYGRSVWSKKPAAVISVSPGAIGGMGANFALRQSMVSLDVPFMPQPEAYIGNAAKLFDESGEPISDGTRTFFGNVMASYAAWVARLVDR